MKTKIVSTSHTSGGKKSKTKTLTRTMTKKRSLGRKRKMHKWGVKGGRKR